MKKINKPSEELRQLLSNKENINNLKEWIDVLISPFKKKGYAKDCFQLSSVLHKGTEKMLTDRDCDLVRIDFPTLAKDLYDSLGRDYLDSGCLTLCVNNQARISFLTDNHSVKKHEELFGGKKNGMNGTYEEISKIYLDYLHALMGVPKLQSNF
jgi:hypothetical protein